MLPSTRRSADYLKVTEYLKGDAAQPGWPGRPLRRPIKPEWRPGRRPPPKQGFQVELPFSPDRALADGLIAAYLNEFRKPIARPSCSTPAAACRAAAPRAAGRGHPATSPAPTPRSPGASPLTNREKLWLQLFSSAVPLIGFEVPAAAPTAKGVAEQADSDAKQQRAGRGARDRRQPR